MLDEPNPRKKRHRRPPASQITPATLIWCPACEEHHPAAAFNKESRRFSGLSGICREAQARKRKLPEEQFKTKLRNKRRWADPEYRNKSLEAARQRRTTKGKEDLRRARARLQRIVDDWKKQGCVDCGYDEIRAIDPDHVEPADKHGNVSRMIQLCASAARIQAELAQCVPRCARCHRLRTAADNPCLWRSAERLPPSWRCRLERQDVNDLVKVMNGCTDCGWSKWARGLDWDHVRGVKVAGVAGLIANGRPWIEVLVEMDKCEGVCANCHRLRTLRRKQYTAWLSSSGGVREGGWRVDRIGRVCVSAAAASLRPESSGLHLTPHARQVPSH